MHTCFEGKDLLHPYVPITVTSAESVRNVRVMSGMRKSVRNVQSRLSPERHQSIRATALRPEGRAVVAPRPGCELGAPRDDNYQKNEAGRRTYGRDGSQNHSIIRPRKAPIDNGQMRCRSGRKWNQGQLVPWLPLALPRVGLHAQTLPMGRQWMGASRLSMKNSCDIRI